MRKLIKYRIYRGEDVDHEKRMPKVISEEIDLIEKVVRYWEDDGKLVNEETSTTYEKNIN